MTDENAINPSESVVPEDKANTPLTPHQIENLRLHIYHGAVGEYKKFVDLVRSLPFNQEMLLMSYHHLDDAMLRIKEAILNYPFLKEPMFVNEENQEGSSENPSDAQSKESKAV